MMPDIGYSGTNVTERPAQLPGSGLVATLRRGFRSACVGIIGDSTGDDKLVGVGTPIDEWTHVFMKRVQQDYQAYSLLERQWNDATQGYDMPIRWIEGTGNGGGLRGAQFALAAPAGMQYVGTSNITGDIDIRVQITPAAWVSGMDQSLVSRWDAGGNGRSFLFILKQNGGLGLNWSATGSAALGEKDSNAQLTGLVNGQPYWVRCTLDVDNGAGGNDLKFYSSPDGITWAQLGSTITTAGTTALFGGTAPYQLASFNGSALTTPYGGKIHWVDIRAGLTSQQSVVAPLPDDWELISGEATLTFTGAPVLMLLNGSQSGQNIAYFDNATRRPIVHQPHGQNIVIISSGHNDGNQSRQTWLTNYAAMVANIKTMVPNVPILVLGQNPTGLGGSFGITQMGVELRASRGAILQQWAASQQGVYGFDAWPLLTAGDLIDQLHPTSGLGSGSEKWGTGLYARLVA